MVIGKKGAGHREAAPGAWCQDDQVGDVNLNIVEIRKTETEAKLVAENIAQQLERRVAFRRAMKRAHAVGDAPGRAGHPHPVRRPARRRRNRPRSETYREGRVPLHTLRGDVDYGTRDGADHLRHLRRQGLGLQGRDHGATTRWRSG